MIRPTLLLTLALLGCWEDLRPTCTPPESPCCLYTVWYPGDYDCARWACETDAMCRWRQQRSEGGDGSGFPGPGDVGVAEEPITACL